MSEAYEEHDFALQGATFCAPSTHTAPSLRRYRTAGMYDLETMAGINFGEEGSARRTELLLMPLNKLC